MKISEMSAEQLKKKSIGDLYKETKLSDEVMADILKIGDKTFESMVEKKYQLEDEKEDERRKFKEAYDNIIEILKKYLDWKEEYYNLVALWIIGTYLHDDFPTYPYLFLNAMKASGKTRALNIITGLSWEGSLLNSLTEAVLFRTRGTLGIDEFEGIERKGKESLRELLNSAYKKGTSVKRMKKIKTIEGENQVVESFDVYRPIVVANISGMESVLEDRCIPLIIERSFNSSVTDLMEIFREEKLFKDTKKLLNQCRLCRCRFSGECIQIYLMWNDFITKNDTNDTNYTNDTNDTNDTKTDISLLFSLKLDELGGRYLELSFPLILLAGEISDDLQKETTLTLKNLFSHRKEEDVTENLDISLIDFVSQEQERETPYFVPLNDFFQRFKNYTQISDDWFNIKWLGRALKRLELVLQKRRLTYGREVILDIHKAQERIKLFRNNQK